MDHRPALLSLVSLALVGSLAVSAAACGSSSGQSGPSTSTASVSRLSEATRVALPPGRNGVIVFTRRFDDGSSGLFTVDLAGRERQLTANSTPASGDVAWTPDGRSITFATEWSGLALADVVARRAGRLPFDSWLDMIAWSPDGSRVAFSETSKDGERSDAELWTANPDGTDLRLLGGTTGNDLEPAWSPDGRWIAFTREDAENSVHQDVYVAAARGGWSARRVAAGATPAWSPDSRQLVIRVPTGPNGLWTSVRLMIVDFESGAARTLTGCNVGSPAWAPADMIAFSDQCGDDDPALYTVAPGGGGRKKIADNARGHPSWSPDAAAIAYATRDGALLVADPDGSGVREVVEPPARYPFSARWSPEGKRLAASFGRTSIITPGSQLIDVPVSDPDWAPDGRRVVGTTGRLGENIAIYDLRSKQMAVIHKGERFGSESLSGPVWSPDGKTIAMSYERDHRGMPEQGVAFYDLARQRVVRWTRLSWGLNPAWSPNGKLLAYDDGGIYGRDAPTVYITRPDGRRNRKLISNASEPAWSPDGKLVAFERGGSIFVVNVDGRHVRRLTSGTALDMAPDWQRLRQ